tara:strand:+ start:1139 stop:1699 length:561 start_codon:yes stop_codon:yes gene_type:complete
MDPATIAMIGGKAAGAGVNLVKSLVGSKLGRQQKKSIMDRQRMAANSPQNLGVVDKEQRMGKAKEQIATGINSSFNTAVRQRLAERGAGQNRGADSQLISSLADGTGKAVAGASAALESADITAEKADIAALDAATAQQQQIEAGQQAQQSQMIQQGFAGLQEGGKDQVSLEEGKLQYRADKQSLA